MKKLALLFLILSTSVHASMLWKIDNGIKLYNAQNYKSALVYFAYYINSNPNDEDGYFWLGKTYLKQNDAKKANLAFQKAYSLALNDKNIDKIDFENNEYDNLEDYFDIAASYYETGNYKESLDYANMMLKIDPDSASAYFIKAKIALIDSNRADAMYYLSKAILLNNSLLNTKLAQDLGINKIPEISVQDCMLYAQKSYFKGDVDSAIRYLKQCLELDDKYYDAYSMLINCYLKNGNIEEAKNILSQGLKNDDNNISLILANAEIEYYNSTNSDKYEHILNKAYNINPNNKTVLLKLANYYAEKKDYSKAKKYFETLVNIDDSLYEGYFGYIYTLIMTGDTTKAQTKIRTLSAIKQNPSEISYLLSLICYANAQYKDALSYIEEAIKKEPNSIYYIEAGKLHYILGNYDLSVRYLSQLTDDSEAREYLILDYLKLNETEKAKTLASNASTVDKNRLSYKYYLYKTYKYDSRRFSSLFRQKPSKIQDSIDLARINLLEGKKDTANKVLINALKKYPDCAKIKYFQQELNYNQ